MRRSCFISHVSLTTAFRSLTVTFSSSRSGYVSIAAIQMITVGGLAAHSGFHGFLFPGEELERWVA